MSTADSLQAALEANPSPPLGTAEQEKPLAGEKGSAAAEESWACWQSTAGTLGTKWPRWAHVQLLPGQQSPSVGQLLRKGTAASGSLLQLVHLSHLSQPCPLPNSLPLQHCQRWFSLRSQRLPWTTLTPAQPQPEPAPRHPRQSLHGFPLLQEQGKSPSHRVSARREALSTFRAQLGIQVSLGSKGGKQQGWQQELPWQCLQPV